MRWLSAIVAVSCVLCVHSYGGYGSRGAQFKERADFEPKRQTLSPVLPPGETPYFPPPEIPMPVKSEKESSSESSESAEKVACGPPPTSPTTTTTTEQPQIQGCGSSAGHVEVDSEVTNGLKLVPPPATAVDAATHDKPDGYEVQAAKETAAVNGYETAASGSSSSGSYSSATKEEIDLYGIKETASSPGVAPVEATTQTLAVEVPVSGGGEYGPVVQPAIQVEVQPSTIPPSPATETSPTTVISTSAIKVDVPSSSAVPSVDTGYEVEVPSETPAPAPKVESGYEVPASSAAPVPKEEVSTTSAATTPKVETPASVPTTQKIESGYEVEVSATSAPIAPSVENGYEVEVPAETPAPAPPSTSQAPVETTTTVQASPPAPPPSTATIQPEIEVPPAVNGYEEPEETPAQQIARIPDNENLYEKIETTPVVIPSTTTTIPYEPPSSVQTEAPYQPPAVPHAQTPSSGYDVVDEVAPSEQPIPSTQSTAAPTQAQTSAPEPYGRQVEAAHITDETASDYDTAAGAQTESNSNYGESSSNSNMVSSVSYGGDVDLETTTSKLAPKIAPIATPYVPRKPAVITTSRNTYTSSSNYAKIGNSASSYTSNVGSYASNNGGYASSIGNSYQNFAPAPLPQPQYVAPPPAFSSFAPAAPSFGSGTQSNGCCGGNWFSSQGSLCAPVNYNPCQPQPSSGCGGCSSGCGQSSSYGFGGSSSCGCQPSCTPSCTPPCPSPCAASSCCCPQAPAIPNFCGGRKKRSIQTILGLCGRKRS